MIRYRLPTTGYRATAPSCLRLCNIITIIRGHATRPRRKVVDPFPLGTATVVKCVNHPRPTTHACARSHARGVGNTESGRHNNTPPPHRHRRHLAPTIPISYPQFAELSRDVDRTTLRYCI